MVLERYKNVLCQDGKNKGRLHEAGDWIDEKKDSFYKLKVKHCKHCNKKVNERVIF